jgi:flavin prenyltransferase
MEVEDCRFCIRTVAQESALPKRAPATMARDGHPCATLPRLESGVLRLIIGISGATGGIYGVRMLEMLRGTRTEIHLVVSKAGEITLHYETGLTSADLRKLADAYYAVGDVGAAISSGSFQTDGMIVVPCSIKTMSAIAYGFSDNLISRAADVILKERRRLVLVVRETPLSLVHLNAMKLVTQAGGIIAPPVPAFYTRPTRIGEVVDQTVGRLLDIFDSSLGERVKRWQGLHAEQRL